MEFDDRTQEEKDLALHIAKMCENMEWENTLPENERAKRRLIKNIQALPRAAELAAKHNMPFVMFGQLERIMHYAELCLGADWMEQARAERSKFFGECPEDDE